MPKVEPKIPTQKPSSDKTYVKGLEGIVAAQTALSLVDGEASKLYYRGIPIGELATDSSFEETIFLLWNNKLPLSNELADFKKKLAADREIPKEILELLQKLPKD